MPHYQANGFHLLPDQKGSMGCQVELVGNQLHVSVREQQISFPLDICGFQWGGLDKQFLEIRTTVDSRNLVLYVQDQHILTDLLQAPLSSRIHQDIQALKRQRSTQGGLTVLGYGLVFAVLVAITFGGYVALHWASERASAMIPPQWQIELGRAGAGQVLESQSLCGHDKAQAMLTQVVQRLVDAAGETPYDFHVLLVDDPQVNAFALPGGMMMVNRGLLENAESVDEVACVLAHEMAHVTHQHGVRNMLTKLGMSVGLRVVLGDTGGLERLLLESAAELGGLAYNRDQEYEADDSGLKLARQAGFDPTGMIVFFERLKSLQGDSPLNLALLSTHPDTTDRQKALLDQLSTLPPANVTNATIAWVQGPILCENIPNQLPEKGTGVLPKASR